MKTIKIQGKEYNIGFDFAVLCEYEELSGKVFDIDILTSSKKEQINFIYAAIRAFNKDVMTLDQFKHTITPYEFNDINLAIAPMITEFYAAPKGDEEKKQGDEGEPSNP